MDTIARLDELLGRASKISDRQAKEAAMLLLSLYSETQDSSRVADYLMKFKSTVCLFFFETAVKTLDPETQIQSIHSDICSTEAYKKNANHAATTRGFIISAVLIKNGVNIARAILMRTLVDVEKEGQFSDAVICNFKQNTVDYCGSLELIQALGEKTWNKPESRNRFLRFMEAVNISNIANISPSKSMNDLAVTTASIVPAIPEPLIPSKEQQAAPILANDATIRLTEELLRMLSSASKEAAELLESLSDSNGTISLLRKVVTNKDSRIAELSTTIGERDRTINDLQRKLNESQYLVRENEAHVADLSERLKNSLQMDNISQNQEMITLISNLKNSLKVEYADYLVSKDSECNPDTYGALIGSLTRIFKTLRRFGITME